LVRSLRGRKIRMFRVRVRPKTRDNKERKLVIEVSKAGGI
jgi:hypothetical protein